MTEQRVVAIGAGARGLDGEPIVLTLGPQHPSAHGALRLRVWLDGDTITRCEPIVGYLHRGVEKLFEVRDYRQIIVLANRHDWLSAFSSELGVVLAVERMLGLELPPRATWTRTLLAELNRVLSHLTFLGTLPAELGGPGGPDRAAYAARETIQRVMEELSGGRMHFMFNRVGGLKEDLPDGWTGRVREAVVRVRTDLAELSERILGDARFVAATSGIGILDAATVLAYGVSGPIARAAGVDLDLRRDDPYLGYAELAAAGTLTVPTRSAGDARARFELLAEQTRISLDLADDCLGRVEALPRGPVGVRLPKILKAPEGHTYCWTENPLGINGYLLVSRGEKTPWRLKLRSASFNNVAALPHAVTGCRVDDLVAILASMFFVVGDIDR